MELEKEESYVEKLAKKREFLDLYGGRFAILNEKNMFIKGINDRDGFNSKVVAYTWTDQVQETIPFKNRERGEGFVIKYSKLPSADEKGKFLAEENVRVMRIYRALDLNESDFKADSSIFETCLKEADSDIGGDKSDTEAEIASGKKIWIDDIREAPDGYIWIKTVREFIDYCVKNGLDDIELIDTDHDAGDYQNDGGDYIRCFDYLDYCGIPDITVHIHSANPVGANNIRRIISKNGENGWREIRNTNEEAVGQGDKSELLEDTTPQDITESIHFDFNDRNISCADIRMIAYSVHVDETDDTRAYNPKNNPDKAVDIFFDYPKDNLKIELFLDRESGEWDSWINGKTGKISPEQYDDFFHTKFYGKLHDKLKDTWANTDPMFARLLDAIENRKYRIDGWEGSDMPEDSEKIEEDSKFGTGKADIERSREKNVAGKQIRSRSGRKYISPSDFSVKHDDNERYYCWPDQRGKGVYKFANWRNWKNIRPLCRMRFAMSNPDHVYGISLSPLPTQNKNRGFRAYDLTAQPPLQYLTPEETDMIMDLSIVRKFLKNAKLRIEKYLDEPDEEIYKKINNPTKCTLDDIRQTKKAIKNALDAIRNFRADTYIYTD
jgi:hypothetical protein